MEYLIMTVVVTVGVVYFMRKKAKEDQAVRDRAFEATMRALEDKAKAEGTFVVSYFDKSSK